MSVILRRVFNKIQGVSYRALKYCTAVENPAKTEDVPIISSKQYDNEEILYQKPRQLWLENLDTLKERKLGLITLHPHIYAASPRIDIIFQNVRWQTLYRWVVSTTYYVVSVRIKFI